MFLFIFVDSILYIFSIYTSSFTAIVIPSYDSSGLDVICTGSEDATVKVWHTTTGKLLKSYRGGSNNVILGVDINGEVAAGCGTDRTCRIWNTRTDRMVSIHYLINVYVLLILVHLLYSIF